MIFSYARKCMLAKGFMCTCYGFIHSKPTAFPHQPTTFVVNSGFGVALIWNDLLPVLMPLCTKQVTGNAMPDSYRNT